MMDEGMISVFRAEYADLVATSTMMTILKDYLDKTEYPSIDVIKIIIGEE